jgi:hypothetical protein
MALLQDLKEHKPNGGFLWAFKYVMSSVDKRYLTRLLDPSCTPSNFVHAPPARIVRLDKPT